MYRNIVYSNKEKCVKLWTWDEYGNRVTHDIPFKPYLYLEQKNGASATSIFKTPLIKKEFDTAYDRKKFIISSGIKRIFYNLPPEQQFLIDKYHGIEDWSSFTKNQLRIFYMDIEVYSPTCFPAPKEAKHPINLITIYDTLEMKFYTWGLQKEFYGEVDNVAYTQCMNEHELLKSFLRYWRRNFPDILSGWNSDGFDIPYVVNRLNNLFGEDYASRLSPLNNIWSVEKEDRFNNPVTEWCIDGITCIDYQKAYKKFARNERESYSLDYISNLELDEGKIDYDPDMSLSTLADEDWDTFVEYNIQDVNLLIKLEQKLHYLELCRMIGYKGLTRFEKALGTNRVVIGAFALAAKKRNLIIPTFEHTKGIKPPGGYVKIPDAGFQYDVVSFDAASLYPNTIITLNLSPETKLGSFQRDDTYTTIYSIKGKEFKLKNEDFDRWVVEKKIAKSMYGILFTQNEKGIIPAIIDEIYSDRKKNKTLGKKLEKKLIGMDSSSNEYHELKRRVEELDVMQYTLKILMNSIYGTFGNSHSELYDVDLAASITLTGQAVNLEASKAIDEYLTKKCGIEESATIYQDTDSCYVSLTHAFKKMNIQLMQDDKINPLALDVIRDIGGEEDASKGFITKRVNKWAKNELNSLDCRFEFKREKICDVTVFLNAKKRYITHNLDIECVPVERGGKKEWSYTGVEVVSSSMASEIKEIVKTAIQSMISKSKTINISEEIKSVYETFCSLPPETLAVRRSIKDLVKYEKRASGFVIGKGTPQNSKAALYHNALLTKLGLGAKYEKLKSGDKIKILYVTTNPYGVDYIAFKNKLPKEFNLVPNYDALYLKNVHGIFERLFEAIGWKLNNPTKNYKCDLEDVFS